MLLLHVMHVMPVCRSTSTSTSTCISICYSYGMHIKCGDNSVQTLSTHELDARAPIWKTLARLPTYARLGTLTTCEDSPPCPARPSLVQPLFFPIFSNFSGLLLLLLLLFVFFFLPRQKGQSRGSRGNEPEAIALIQITWIGQAGPLPCLASQSTPYEYSVGAAPFPRFPSISLLSCILLHSSPSAASSSTSSPAPPPRARAGY
ncbi:hypothetical protein V8C37DRAFT_182086 [Trichoderma ceciliae]